MCGWTSSRLERDDFSSNRHPALSFCLSMISAQTLRVCREGKPVPTFPDRALFARRRLPRIGNGLIKLRHGERAGHAKLSDDKGRRTLETERLGLIVVARQDRVDRLGVGGKVARDAIDIDTRAGQRLTQPRLGQL